MRNCAFHEQNNPDLVYYYRNISKEEKGDSPSHTEKKTRGKT